MFGTRAPLRYVPNLIPSFPRFAPPAPPSTLAQSKERKGSNFAIWQPWWYIMKAFPPQGPPGAVAVVSLASLAQPAPIQPNITSMTSMAAPVQPTMQTISAIQPICSLAAAVPAAITVQVRESCPLCQIPWAYLTQHNIFPHSQIQKECFISMLSLCPLNEFLLRHSRRAIIAILLG